jgi:ATP-dependent DNA helicase RecG
VVEYADLNDLIRLHRLRTHVAFGNAPGLCCMVLSDSPNPAARELVELVAGESDGFRLAELDLQNRGLGESAPGGKGKKGKVADKAANRRRRRRRRR